MTRGRCGSVESTTGAVAVGPGELPLAGGFRLVPVPQAGPSLRFQSLLIKPDVRISRIQLSDWLHREAHGGDTRCWRRRRTTPSFSEMLPPETCFVPRPCSLCRLRRKLLTRS
jgi:hypothetical protein